MQSAGLLYDVHSRTQIQVICVAQDNLGLDVVFKFVEMHSLDRTHCANRHENRGLYSAVRSGYESRSRVAVQILFLQFKIHIFRAILFQTTKLSKFCESKRLKQQDVAHNHSFLRQNCSFALTK